jgi:hypothetical protein
MYRIELSPGEETVFRSIAELAVAIKRGVVSPRARIYHNASNKWLPIQFHPHYKAALAMPLTQAELVAGPQVRRPATLTLAQPEIVDEPAVLAHPAPRAEIPEPRVKSPRSSKKSRADRSSGSKRARRAAKPRRQLRIALIGALLIGGAQWVLSAPLFSRPEAPAMITAQRHLIASPTAAMRRVSSPNTAAMVPVLPNSSGPSSPAALDEITDLPPGVSAPSFGGGAAGVETGVAGGVEPDSASGGAADSTARQASRPRR